MFYHKDEAGDEQHDIHQLSMDGASEPVIEIDGQLRLTAVGDDGETLLFGSTRDGQMNIYRHDLSSDETTKLIDYERAAGGAELSPDCTRFAFTTNERDNSENQDVYVGRVDGSNVRRLDIGAVGAEASPVDFGPNGDRLLVSDNSENLTRSGVYDLTTDEIEWFGSEYDESPSHFVDDGDRFVATRTRDSVDVPVVYDTETGAARELALPEGVSVMSDTPLTDGRRLLYQRPRVRGPNSSRTISRTIPRRRCSKPGTARLLPTTSWNRR